MAIKLSDLDIEQDLIQRWQEARLFLLNVLGDRSSPKIEIDAKRMVHEFMNADSAVFLNSHEIPYFSYTKPDTRNMNNTVKSIPVGGDFATACSAIEDVYGIGDSSLNSALKLARDIADKLSAAVKQLIVAKIDEHRKDEASVSQAGGTQNTDAISSLVTQFIATAKGSDRGRFTEIQ